MKVLVAGTFDVFHSGHESFLQQAKKLGTELFVIVARESSVLRIKKIVPYDSEKVRMQNVIQTGIADFVFLGDENDFLKIPLQIQPDIIALGYDQIPPFSLLQAFPHTKIVRLHPFYPDQFKSSLLRPKTL